MKRLNTKRRTVLASFYASRSLHWTHMQIEGSLADRIGFKEEDAGTKTWYALLGFLYFTNDLDVVHLTCAEALGMKAKASELKDWLASKKGLALRKSFLDINSLTI